jgi:hypothetical protein
MSACGQPKERTLWGEQLELVFHNEESEALRLNSRRLFVEISIVRGVDPELQQRIVTEKLKLFESAFRTVRTGYPGQLTTQIMCPEPYTPTYETHEVPGGGAQFHRAWANPNGAIGACTSDAAVYRVATGHLLCHSGALVQWSARVPSDDQESLGRLLERMDCEL